jgi:hypothetical protein
VSYLPFKIVAMIIDYGPMSIFHEISKEQDIKKDRVQKITIALIRNS